MPFWALTLTRIKGREERPRAVIAGKKALVEHSKLALGDSIPRNLQWRCPPDPFIDFISVAISGVIS